LEELGQAAHLKKVEEGLEGLEGLWKKLKAEWLMLE
jgi:hypothetical protein